MLRGPGREALRAALAAEAGEPIPRRLQVAHLMAERRRQLARIATVIGLLMVDGAAGLTARDVSGSNEKGAVAP